jgi:hypothetical protein
MRTLLLLLLSTLPWVATTSGCNETSSARETSATPATHVATNDSATRASAADSSAPKSSAYATGIVETTFDDLKFPMEKTDTYAETMLTDEVKSLFGQRIRIRGYMFPTPLRRGLKQFVLVRDNMECCFGPGAALFDCVLVNMEEGSTAEYAIRPIAVEGEFRYEPLPGPDGQPVALFRLTGEAVR